MCLCFYLFFAGLILLYTVAYDLWKIGRDSKDWPGARDQHAEFNEVSHRVMHAIFRCTTLGILIAIAMKVQSAYLLSRGENIVAWLIDDMTAAFYGRDEVGAGISYRTPTHYSSFLVALSTCLVFLDASIRLDGGPRRRARFWAMLSVVAILFSGYLLTDAFTGFSILLGFGVLLAVYGLFDPRLGRASTR